MSTLTKFIEAFLSMFVDMAFYIMIGLFFVGILHTYVNREKILKHLGTNKFSSVVKASMVGIPLPLCSCGVVPTAVELKRGGASNGAVISFLMSTPQTGVDSIAATYSMMGLLMAIYRPIAAFFSGIVGGAMVNLFAKDDIIRLDLYGGSCCSENSTSSCGCDSTPSSCGCESTPSSCGCESTPSSCGCESTPSSCGCGSDCGGNCSCGDNCHCHDGMVLAMASSCGCATVPSTESSCCSLPQKETPKFLQAMKYAYCDFLDEISVHFLLGIFLASLISAFVPADFFISFGINQGILSMFAMVLIGVPMYICSTSSIPIALSLITKGLSLGSAFVFLFTGPVTNIASLLVLGKVLGKKITTMYLSIVILCSLFFGSLLDFLATELELNLLFEQVTHHHHHSEEMHLFTQLVALVFACLLGQRLFLRTQKKRH